MPVGSPCVTTINSSSLSSAAGKGAELYSPVLLPGHEPSSPLYCNTSLAVDPGCSTTVPRLMDSRSTSPLESARVASALARRSKGSDTIWPPAAHSASLHSWVAVPKDPSDSWRSSAIDWKVRLRALSTTQEAACCCTEKSRVAEALKVRGGTGSPRNENISSVSSRLRS